MSDMGNSALNERLRTKAEFLEPGRVLEKIETGTGDRIIAIIEDRVFLRECIRRSMQSSFSLPVVTYSTVLELKSQLDQTSAELVIISWMEVSNEANVTALKILTELLPGVPIIVLASANDADLARTAVYHGAKGYIPLSMGFEVAIEAVRFVLAGGTYVPIDCLVAGRSGPKAFQYSQPLGVVTSRELAVIHAIRQGKSNKVIAYELNMCESTVKVHVRNVMRKLNARNCTEAAIKAQFGSHDATPAELKGPRQ